MNKTNIKHNQLVLCLPENQYQRFIGRTRTHHVVSDQPLSKEDVEVFRTNPDSMLEPEVA